MMQFVYIASKDYCGEKSLKSCGNNDSLSGEICDTGSRRADMGMIEDIHDNVGNILGSVYVHLVRNIVQVEQVSQEIGGNPELGVGSVRIAHRCEHVALEAIECSALLLGELDAISKPIS